MASIVRAVGNNGYTIKTGVRDDYTIISGSLVKDGNPTIKFPNNVVPILAFVQCKSEKIATQNWRMLEVKMDNWQGRPLASTYVGDIGYITDPGSPFLQFSPLYSQNEETVDVAKYAGSVFFINNSLGPITNISLFAWIEL